MTDLPLPTTHQNSSSTGTNSTSKTSDAVRSAILGQADETSVVNPIASTSVNQSPTLGAPRPTGFIAQPPPAAVTALSSVSGNRPPILTKTDDEDLPPPSAMPVRATTSLPELVVKSINSSQDASSVPTNPIQPPIPPVKQPPSNKPVSQTPTKQPVFAQAKQPLIKWLPFIAGGLIIFIFVVWLVSKLLSGGGTKSVSTKPSSSNGQTDTPQENNDQSEKNNSDAPAKNVTIEYWGLWESEANMTAAIKSFEEQNPGIKIQYVKQSHIDYRERLQTALSSGNGPDVFRFHASWTPMFYSQLAPVPSTVYTTADYKSTFYPAAVTQLQQNSQIMGIPLMYDGLMLYYNTEVFNAAGEKPPTTWSELRVLANKLTLKDGGEIKRAGIAMGNATNVDHFSDILGLLMLQNGADLMYPNSTEGRDALLFYTNFVTKDNVWNSYLPNSTVAFSRGDVAMMFAPSWRAHEITAMNPDLKFATAPLPQLSNSKITWANYWAEGVNVQSKQKDAAWKFLAYLSSKEGAQKLYATQAESRSFGEPYARVDLADDLASHQLLSPLLQDAPYAKGWYMSSFTHDNGINDLIIKYYQDAVNKIVGGESVQTVLEPLQAGVSQVTAQYQVSKSL